MIDFGSRIKNIRYNRNISQEDMARELDINRNYLSRIENNKTWPSAEVLIKLAKTFDISIDSLLGISSSNNDVEKDKLKKINKINQYCSYLSNSELDFVINVLWAMTNEVKQK